MAVTKHPTSTIPSETVPSRYPLLSVNSSFFYPLPVPDVDSGGGEQRRRRGGGYRTPGVTSSGSQQAGDLTHAMNGRGAQLGMG